MIEEQNIRQILAGLRPDETLTTRELLVRLMPNATDTERTKAASSFIKRWSLPQFCTLGDPQPGKAFNKGKLIRPRIWHRLENATMPQTPDRPSSGAASPASSLIARVDAIEAWIAARDPLFRVL